MNGLLIGGVSLAYGLYATVTNVKNWQRRKRVLAMPTSSIAEAPGNGAVEIKGRIVPGEQGLVQAPFSGRQVVWCRITVQELRHTIKSRRKEWKTVFSEEVGLPFFVEDGSGQLARVLPKGAAVVLDTQEIASSGTFNDAAPHLEAFLKANGMKSTSFLGLNKGMRYQEEVLGPNDPVYALGPSRREVGPPVQDGYRTTPGTQLVMEHGGPTDELILTNKTEEQLTSNLRSGFDFGLVVTAIGVVITLASILLK